MNIVQPGHECPEFYVEPGFEGKVTSCPFCGHPIGGRGKFQIPNVGPSSGATVEIQLSRGGGDVAIVDAEDYEFIKHISWSLTNGYAMSHTFGKGALYLHHVIIGTPPFGAVVDHINRNRLDNRKSNLRFASKQQNAWNSRCGIPSNTGFIGVRKSKDGTFVAHTKVGGKPWSRKYSSLKSAALARDKKAREFADGFILLNFPPAESDSFDFDTDATAHEPQIRWVQIVKTRTDGLRFRPRLHSGGASKHLGSYKCPGMAASVAVAARTNAADFPSDTKAVAKALFGS